MLHLCDGKCFVRMLALPKRTIFCTIAALICPEIFVYLFAQPFVIKQTAPKAAAGTVLVFIFNVFAISISRTFTF